MVALEQTCQYLESLGLAHAAEALEDSLDAAAAKKLSYLVMLTDLPGIEVRARRERCMTTRTRLAHLPFKRTLEEFDFDFQPSIDERLIRKLASMAFVAKASNLVLLGPPGVGKTHPAMAMALKAIESGYGAYLCCGLRPDGGPKKASAEERLRRRRRVYLAPKLLIIDEFGIWLYGREAATALFSLVAERYERGIIILTSKKGFAEWGDLLGDTVVATAILDPLLHHSHVINIRGSSYRLREKQQAGLAGLGLGDRFAAPRADQS